MALLREELAERIRLAFRNVRLEKGVGLFEAQAIDDYENDEVRAKYRAKDEKVDWSAIPIKHLNECYSSPSFFDAEGMRFHLPALLLADLRNELDPGNPVFQLTSLDEYSLSRFSSLSADQRATVREYLLFVQDDPTRVNAGNRALRRALENYWTA